jgi:hypothetical protein
MGLINKNNLPPKQESPQSPFTKEEMEILLRIIAEGTFKGKEIQVVYDLVYKLQQMYLDK